MKGLAKQIGIFTYLPLTFQCIVVLPEILLLDVVR